jgi:hypothetical protein
MSDNIQEAEVGSGTKVADTKQSEKRAQLTLKAIQLRLKQEKERVALQQQKKSLQKEETMNESFSASQIAALKAEYSKISGIDPASDTYKKLIAMLDRLDLKSLQSLAGAEIKFVSGLAKNRVMRKSMKKEEMQIDELSTNKLADYKKKAGENASAADKAGDTKTGNKRFSGIMKATRKQFDNDAKKTNEELDIELDEVLSKDATAGDFIHDFVNSDNPKFAGKTKEKRIQMALAAYYAKQKNEELSPKQKALDKNKNGKIDGSDLAKLRGEELSAKQKALDKNNNGKIDGSDLAHLRSKKKLPQGADFAAQRRKERMASNGRMDEEVKVGDKVSFNHPMKAIPGKTMKKVGTVHKVEDDTIHIKVKDKYGVITHKKTASELTKEEFDVEESASLKPGWMLKRDPELAKKVKEKQDLAKKRQATYGDKSAGKSVNEKSDYEVYHKDYSTAVQTAIKQAEKRGYEVDMDDWHDKVATGPKKPSSGKTNSFSINLMKDGKSSKKKLQMQVYNMDNHKYELNMYIEEIEQGVAEGLIKDIKRLATGKDVKSRAGQEIAKSQDASMKGDTKTSKKHFGRFDKLDKLANKEQGVAEEVQELDELNKDTVYSYAKKSEKDQDDQYNKIGKGIRDNDPKSANKAGHKFSMRSIGQNRAEKRLAKEAASPAQQAAIAIAMKKAGKTPKMSESIVDKIKAIKRGMQAKAKADDHFDKAGDPKNANASKDLKKAVRYHNLLNKEQTGEKMNTVTKNVTKGELTKSGVAKWLAEPMKKEEKVPEFKQGGSELAKKFNKAFKANGVTAKVKIRTVGNVSANEEVVLEARKKSFKDVKKKMKEEETPNKAAVKKGDMLTGKKEPIEINPELKEPAR